ncbi:uncharacterized protein LOC127614733 isoform X2 [Hippocampus zosterae]|uniref:uncharacterized protein LOC127614733 isoform X2 n=1 Tax=Hippocampus zosterae TaxID=109293 RepID=UPI00223E35A6|nr:uncharacterized protein LOC127614733 isoform X2 [Hippocampus zosterae]
MLGMKVSAVAVVALLLIGPSEVFGLLTARDRDRSFRTQTVTQDSAAPPDLPVIWTELLGLRQLVLSLQAAVVDQRQTLRTSESRLRDGQEAEVKRGQQLDAMQIQMDADRTLVLGLQAAAADQRNDLRATENRLRESEEATEKQRQVLDTLQVQVEAVKNMVSEINADLKRREERRQGEVSRLQSRLDASESSVENVKRKTSVLAGELPFLRTRLRASESALEQLKQKSSGYVPNVPDRDRSNHVTSIVGVRAVLASRLCLVENLRKRSSVEDAEVQGHHNSTTALFADGDGQRREAESRLDADSSRIHQNMSALHTRLLHLEGKVMSSEQHLQDIKAAVVNAPNDTQTQSEKLKARLSVVENLVEDLWTDKSASELRINVSERLLEELKTECAAQKSQLSKMESQATHNHAELAVRLNVSEKLVDELKTEWAGECVCTRARRFSRVLVTFVVVTFFSLGDATRRGRVTTGRQHPRRRSFGAPAERQRKTSACPQDRMYSRVAAKVKRQRAEDERLEGDDQRVDVALACFGAA